jgi:predicted helicase
MKNIRDFKSLLSWLSHELNWDTGIDDYDDIEDVTYNFDARDIHLKPEEFAHITSLKQLRPLYEKQPWGIFAVEFEGKRLEVNSLRKILSGLVPKRRNRDHAVWDKKNLLFFCFWGEKNNRSFGVVHFEDKTNVLPSIKTFFVSPKNEDIIHLQYFEEKFRKLAWPDFSKNPSPADYKGWYEQWAAAFTSIYRQTIRDSSALTANLAEIALGIRQRILDIFTVETENGAIHNLYKKFKKTLIHDMTEAQFADMYAQTIVYGLFSARCMIDMKKSNDEDEYSDDNKHFEPRQAIDAIPSTNPFLQNLLKESFSRKDALSFDELDLGDITLLLQNTDTKLIIDDFNRQTGGGKEDPVIYFYEGFLNAYEKEQKKRRGVYYTPLPVVKFMVQAVDDILKTEFGIKDGLASTQNKTISITKKKNGKDIGIETKTVPAIQILDPAVGTGTFLRQIILQIWDNFKKLNAGQTKKSIQRQWNVYVKNDLLPRLNGFELMMAPYAVAHMKLALVLLDTEYAFDEDQEHPDRIRVFLTNSLEEADREEGQGMMFEHDALAEESKAAKETKKNRGINVVIGNPPYNSISVNNGDRIISLLDDYKKEPGGIEKLQERKHWLYDDYVKFIRYAQLYVERAGSGIVAYINNHGFLDNPTFRGMRWNLLKSFDKIYIIDLHGHAKKKETTQEGGKDENVFDIQQGVSINIFIKNTKNLNKDNNDINKETRLANVYHYDLYGLRKDKYNFLYENNINSIKWQRIDYKTPLYFFLYKSNDNQEIYETGFQITKLFINQSTGLFTLGDNFIIDNQKSNVKERILKFINNRYDEQRLKKEYSLGKNYPNWIIENKSKIVFDESKLVKITYRPFDIKWTYYDSSLIWRTRQEVMNHLLNGKNIGFITARSNKSKTCDHFFITKYICELKCGESLTGSYAFPLYLYEGRKRRPNLNSIIINEIEKKLNLSFVPEKSDSLTLTNNGFKESSFAPGQLVENSFTPLDLFDYIYAVLHSPAYRETYREFLKIDFPRIPYPVDSRIFWKIVALGGELRRLHLLEGKKFEKIEANSVSMGKVLVEKVRYSDGQVFVNDDFCFDDVPQTAWEFYIGGYQPAQKWLKDRKGCILKSEDFKHYRKIVLALTETARIMGEIDKVRIV